MSYISIFIAPIFLFAFLKFAYGWRDSYRKARESFGLMALAVGMFISSIFFLMRSSSEEWVISNIYAWVALVGMVVGLVALFTIRYVKIKKYASEFPVLEQETMYQTGIPLDKAYASRVLQYNGAKAAKVTTCNIDLSAVDEKKELWPHVKQEIIDIINNKNTKFYEYGLTHVEPTIPADQIEQGFSPFYRAVLNIARKNLKAFDINLSFSEVLQNNGYVAEYAILDILEQAKAIKNTPMGDLGSLVESAQDEHFLGACGSLGFTSVGRSGIAIYVGYRLNKQKGNKQ